MQFKHFVRRQKNESHTDEKEKPGDLRPWFLWPETGKQQDQSDSKQLNRRKPGRNRHLAIQVEQFVYRTGQFRKHVEKIDQNQKGFKKQQDGKQFSHVLFSIRQISFYDRIHSLKNGIVYYCPVSVPEVQEVPKPVIQYVFL